ncbi:MAG: hypothetical protein BGN88_07635 [Clostridiales bacterium 43-6]|nr:MAG: hypothetical protein BGN88_07635 [Clostridiales bacterium 43-6]
MSVILEKVLVTGVNGFVAKNILKSLITQYEIIGVSVEDVNMTGFDITYIQADIADFDNISRIFEEYKPDFVIHLAAIVHKKSMLADYDAFYKINYLASENIFKNCVSNHVKKILFSSTVEVYDLPENAEIFENSTINPPSDYGKTKIMAEKSLIETAQDSGLNYAVMRFAPVYSKEFMLNIDRRIYLKKNKILYYFGKGDYFFNMCSVNNIVDFISAFIEKDHVSGIYNISDSETFTVKQIVLLEKEKTNSIVIKMPYYLTVLAISIVEFVITKLLRKKSVITRYNIDKIFKCNIFNNHRALTVVNELKWNIKNTIYS